MTSSNLWRRAAASRAPCRLDQGIERCSLSFCQTLMPRRMEVLRCFRNRLMPTLCGHHPCTSHTSPAVSNSLETRQYSPSVAIAWAPPPQVKLSSPRLSDIAAIHTQRGPNVLSFASFCQSACLKVCLELQQLLIGTMP